MIFFSLVFLVHVFNIYFGKDFSLNSETYHSRCDNHHYIFDKKLTKQMGVKQND